MRLKGIRSLRELTRILEVDQRLRRLCRIKKDDNGYPRSVISRFTKRIGAETLQLIIEEKVVMLLRRSKVEALQRRATKPESSPRIHRGTGLQAP